MFFKATTIYQNELKNINTKYYSERNRKKNGVNLLKNGKQHQKLKVKKNEIRSEAYLDAYDHCNYDQD